MTRQERDDLLDLFRTELRRIEDVLKVRLTLLEQRIRELEQQQRPLDARARQRTDA